MIYFVTGATGFIGGRLVRILLDDGHQVHILARRPHRALELKKRGARIFQGDILDKASMLAPMKNCDGIFHIAADYGLGVRDRASMYNTNVRGTRNVLSLMRELSIPAGVYTSTIAINSDTRGVMADESYFFQGSHLSWYAETKWKAHYDVAMPFIHDDLPLTIVQPCLVYGPGDQSAIALTLEQFLRGRLPFLPAETRYCWAHVDDIAQGHFLAMKQGRQGESYVLGGPDHSLREAFRIASRLTRRRVPPISVPPIAMRFLASFASLVENSFRLPPHLSSESLLMSAGTTHIASSEKAETEFGYSCRSLEVGLKGTLADLAARISRKLERAVSK